MNIPLFETDRMTQLILRSLPDEDYIRIHESGDFFSEAYFYAWVLTGRMRPKKVFYFYTKSLHFLPDRSELPSNIHPTMSYGGKFDHLIPGLREKGYFVAYIVHSEEEAAEMGLPIDHDDSHAIAADHDFCLLLHGTQPKGSPASEALKKLRKDGKGGYRRYFKKGGQL